MNYLYLIQLYYYHSGVTVTYAHHSLIQGNRSGALYGLVATIILAIIFTGFQGIEYTVSSFTISDGAFGSCFYFGTGFHGLHVMIGTAFLAVGLWRVLAYHSNWKSSFRFRIRYIILTFCGCCMIILIYFNILLRFINILLIIHIIY